MEKKSKRLCIRTTFHKREWMRDRNISPTKVFENAINDLKADDHKLLRNLMLRRMKRQEKNIERIKKELKKDVKFKFKKV